MLLRKTEKKTFAHWCVKKLQNATKPIILASFVYFAFHAKIPFWAYHNKKAIFVGKKSEIVDSLLGVWFDEQVNGLKA